MKYERDDKAIVAFLGLAALTLLYFAPNTREEIKRQENKVRLDMSTYSVQTNKVNIGRRFQVFEDNNNLHIIIEQK